MTTNTNERIATAHDPASRRTWLGLCLLATGLLGAGTLGACDMRGRGDVKIDRADPDDNCGEVDVLDSCKEVYIQGLEGQYEPHTGYYTKECLNDNECGWMLFSGNYGDHIVSFDYYLIRTDNGLKLDTRDKGTRVTVATLTFGAGGPAAWGDSAQDGLWQINHDPHGVFDAVRTSCGTPVDLPDPNEDEEDNGFRNGNVSNSYVCAADGDHEPGEWCDPAADNSMVCAYYGKEGTFACPEDCSGPDSLVDLDEYLFQNGCLPTRDESCCEIDVGSAGCGNDTCQAAVCALDSYCCSTGWDEQCVGIAMYVDECAPGEGDSSNLCESTTGTGSCYEANDTRGCDDKTCQDAVCASGDIGEQCCGGTWAEACADLARSDELAGSCAPPVEAVCGNGVIEAGEICEEGVDFQIPHCIQGDEHGWKRCVDCQIVCEVEEEPGPVCGNGELEEGEECDYDNYEDAGSVCLLNGVIPGETFCTYDCEIGCAFEGAE